MGFLNDFKVSNPTENVKKITNIEWVLSLLDKLRTLASALVSKTANGLTPQLPNEAGTTKFLRQDGTWAVPPDTTHSEMSGTTLGLVKLNGNYTFTGTINVPTPTLPS
jgi:hypothetical protein